VPRALVCLLLAACGRIGFEPASGSDGSIGNGDGDGDGATDRPNVAFVTAVAMPGGFGGLAAADALCNSEAASAGLPGTFVAFLSTATQPAPARLAGSRGWVRPDGEPLIDQPADLFVGGRMFNALELDAAGNYRANMFTWTGTTEDGLADPQRCGDWTTTTGNGLIGLHQMAAPQAVAASANSCANPSHIYCFEIGHVAPVSPRAIAGRIAFITGSNFTLSTLAAIDNFCASEAAAAGLAGTFRAAIATTTTSIADRFTGVAGPYRRPDGTLVALTPMELFDSTRLRSPPNQFANGAYASFGFVPVVRTGAGSGTSIGTAQTTCSGWTTTAGTGSTAGNPLTTDKGDMYGSSSIPCAAMEGFLCVGI
jgi:hypothetical protein